MRSGSPSELIASLRGDTSAVTSSIKFAGKSSPLPKHVKICGLTRSEDAIVAVKHGASFMGVIFAESSPRRQTPDQAYKLVRSVHKDMNWSSSDTNESLAPHLLSLLPIPTGHSDSGSTAKSLEIGYRILSNSPRPLFVGVFQDQPLSFITSTVVKVGLDLVQLHGDESDSMIPLIPAPVIRVVHVLPGMGASQIKQKVISAVSHGAAAVLLDTAASSSSSSGNVGKGGTGQVFDWKVVLDLAHESMYIMLAGGLTSENVGQVSVLGEYVWCVDASSGLESGVKGVKDAAKIAAFFKAIS